jgi:hypothetical protein
MPNSEDIENLSNSIRESVEKEFNTCKLKNEPSVSYIHIDYISERNEVYIIISLDNTYYQHNDFVEDETDIIDVIGVEDLFKKLFSGIENATTLSKKEISNLMIYKI